MSRHTALARRPNHGRRWHRGVRNSRPGTPSRCLLIPLPGGFSGRRRLIGGEGNSWFCGGDVALFPSILDEAQRRRVTPKRGAMLSTAAMTRAWKGRLRPPWLGRAAGSWWQFWKWPWFAGRVRRGAAPTLPTDGRILFYRRDRQAFGFLSNFHPSPITIDGETWPTVEHYYQAQKSLDPEYRRAVRQAVTPGQAKRLGATPGGPRRLTQQSWFRRHGQQPRPDWAAVKLNAMRTAVRAKFTQNRKLAESLSATGTAELVEDSATDAFWGAGADGRGENWLGRVLMEVRQDLAGRQP